MKVIGVTGNSGSGKSFASVVMSDMGGLIVNLDQIGHLIYENEECFQEITNSIPGDFVVDGKIARKKLSQIVFADYSILKKLTEITDKYIYNETKKIIDANKDVKFIILDGALIFDSKILELCDSIIIIDAQKDIKIKRIMERDNILYENALKRVNSQKDYTDYKHQSKFIILNNNSEIDFVNKIKEVINYIVK